MICDIEDMQKNNAFVFDTASNSFALEKCDPNTNQVRQLKEELSDIFGITIDVDFSIIDPAPFGNLEGKLLDIFVKKHPGIFNRLNLVYNAYAALYQDMKDLVYLHSQFVFYSVYVSFVKRIKAGGIDVCRPHFDGKGYFAEDCSSIILAVKSLQNKTLLDTIAANDISLPKRKTFILSGPNQGGKTIYLKSVGLTAFLAKCGCFVLCKSCTLPFFDTIDTHFMQKEALGKGRLVEEVERIEKIINSTTADSLLLLNESFATTRRYEGTQIAVHYIKKLMELGCSVGFVSHYYEISGMLGEEIISLTCGIKDGERTYKISENSGETLAYARDIAFRTGMTYEQMHDEMMRIKNEKV
jgi:hypothetical protein